MITGIAYTSLIVLDYEEAIEFYCGKLGFIVAEDTQLENKRWIRLRAPGGKGSEILLSKAADEKQRAAIGNQTCGRVLFFLHTDDFDADYAKFRSMGIEFTEGPSEHDYGKVAVFKDLYGNRIDLIQPRTAGIADAKPLSYLSTKTAVRPSPIHGKGLFAIAPIHKGEIVCGKGGHIFTRERVADMNARLGSAEIPIADDLFIGPVTEDERTGGMIWSNHSCDPNIGVQGQIVFVAMRDIAAGEELTHDWAMTDNDIYEMECNCGAANCRKVITGRDWRKPELQQRYKGFMSRYLEEKITR